MNTYQIDSNGYYGEFGGAYIPEILYKTVETLKESYLPIIESPEFKKEYHALLRDYVGRPSPLYYASRMSQKYGCKLYLKREDLNHTGAHKINNSIGQILLAKRMGKTRIIAETGAGQHGVATATVCALMNMPCKVYMGALDVERQAVNHKEEPFYINIPAKDVIETVADENILVQGIIDLYYINKDNQLVLLDYKTDYVVEGDEYILVERHKPQLMLYKKALEEGLNRKVDRIIIYATGLGKEVEI